MFANWFSSNSSGSSTRLASESSESYVTARSQASTAFYDVIENWLGGSTQTLRKRRYRPLKDDPFCTDVSFFRSGRYRPTAYNRDRDLAPNVIPRRDPRRGPYTGAARPDYPRVHRKFGNNTRERVMPFRRYNRMHVTGYDDAVVGSEPVPPFLPPTAALGQSGSEAVLAAAGLRRTLGVGRPGDGHFLLDGSN